MMCAGGLKRRELSIHLSLSSFLEQYSKSVCVCGVCVCVCVCVCSTWVKMFLLL